MAALTSTQSGNFSSASTWGGTAPADGDTFTITAGHEIIVNSDIRQTNGYGDITVRGHLKFETNGKFRLNGRITVKGYNTAAYNLTGGAWFTEGSSASAGLISSSGTNMLLEVRGSNSDQHGIWIENERYASMKFEADYKRLNVTTSAKLNINDDYISVTNASNFAAEDWISIFRDDNQDNAVTGDEGFWVHDVDTTNNRIYYRQFVAPKSDIVAVSGVTVTVQNAKVFRKGYKLICGTGSSRKVATVSAIDYSTNKLTMDSAFASANVGQTLHQTGAEKEHESGDRIERCATTLTTAIETVDSTNQITVGNASDISVGDTIIIDANNNDTNWDYDVEYNVTAKSGNTLTLDDQVRHKHFKGSLVNILSRNFTIKGVDTDSDTRPFLYVEYWTTYNDARTRHICIKNVRFTQWGGNTNSTYYRAVMIAGYNSAFEDASTDNRNQYQSKIQGIVIDNCNNKTSYTGLTTRHPHGLVVRNNCVYNIGGYNYWNWSSQHNLKWYNNYATRSNYCCFYGDGMYEPYNEWAYNYYTRSDDYATLWHHNRESNKVRHHILLNHENRFFYHYYQGNGSVYERFLVDGFRTDIPYVGVGGGEVKFLDSCFNNRWVKNVFTKQPGEVWANDYSVWGGDDGRANYNRTTGRSMFQQSYEHNFEYDLIAQAWGAQYRYKNNELGNDWVVVGTEGNYLWFGDQIYVPSGITVRISCTLKTPADGSFSYPFLFARPNYGGYNAGRYHTDRTGQTAIVNSANAKNPSSGFLEQVYWDANGRGDYQVKQITVAAQDKGYFLVYGVSGASSNGRQELFYFQDPEVYFDSTPAIKNIGGVAKKGIEKRASFTPSSKKRIGGTRL
jgi:hypothetical protein